MAPQFPRRKIGNVETSDASYREEPLRPKKQQRQFVGLSNQGATCYMNSLLQTLYMTPDLRQRLYHWNFAETPGSSKEDSIPYQLQLLFGRLQLSGQPSIDTKGLTTSFQWDYRDLFTQHDVQEFCRVLFDAIEQSVSPPHKAMISDLYEGSLIDYVQCRDCGTESSRLDKFLDVSLAVRSEGVHSKSLLQAFDIYVKPEVLTGANQYFCSVCRQKRDAIKGLRFKSFPTVLILQLKRFELDYRTMKRKKLNDRVEFPMVLDLNPYVAEEDRRDKHKKPRTSPAGVDVDAVEMDYIRSFLDRPMSPDAGKSPLSCEFPSDSPPVRPSAPPSFSSGQYIYELFSVMVHSGSAVGGHYFAYIQCLEDRRWYLFDDSDVSQVSEAEVTATYGGDSTSAYVLAYRKLREGEETVQVRDEEVPAYIRDAVQEDRRREIAQMELQKARQKLISLRVFYKTQEKTLEISRERTVRDLLEAASSEFQVAELLPDNVRLRGYAPQQETMTEVHADLAVRLDTLMTFCTKCFCLETKSPEDSFLPYDPSLISLRVVPWRSSFSLLPVTSLSEKSSAALKVSISTDESLFSLIQRLGGTPKSIILLRRTGIGTAENLCTEGNFPRSLRELKIGESSLLYMEEKSEDGKWAGEFAEELKRISLKYSAPSDPTPNSALDLHRQVLISSSATLCSLRATLSKALDLPPSAFIIRKGWSKLGCELRDDGKSLWELGVAHNCALCVELGSPVGKEEVRIEVMLAGSPKPGSADACVASLYELITLVAAEKTTVTELKAQIRKLAIEKFPTAGLEYFHLREKVQDRLGRALRESDLLADYPPLDSKSLVVQVVEDGRDLATGEVIGAVKFWKQTTWQLVSLHHLIIPKSLSLLSLGMRLSALYCLPQSRLEATKVLFASTFTAAELPFQTWTPLTAENMTVERSALSVITDGFLLIVRDKSESVPTGGQPVPKPLPSDFLSSHMKEKPVTITVKHVKSDSS